MSKKKRSFLDEFVKVKKVDGICVKDRSKGFRYLHDTITKRLALGESFKIGNLNFSKFTDEDIEEYFSYYSNYLEPIAKESASILYKIFSETSKFPKKKNFRGVSR